MKQEIKTKAKVTISTKAGTLILSAYAVVILYVAVFLGLFR
ncbi:MAG: hypothetical protein WCV92_01940 [Candidatus Buchananbacteria bacterium]